MRRVERKVFVLRKNEDRPILFTPTKYEARTGMLHGYDNGERPLSIPVGTHLSPYEPMELEWDDD